MKYLLSINELFNSNSDATVIKSSFNEGSLYYGAVIDILIKNIPYRFKTQIKNLDGGTSIYLSYHIIDYKNFKSDNSKDIHSEYEFIINKNMTISVLNAIPLFIEEYKKLLLSKDKNPLISGLYFDADEEKRRKIYFYYFKNRLGNRLKDIRKSRIGGYIMVNLIDPIILSDFYI